MPNVPTLGHTVAVVLVNEEAGDVITSAVSVDPTAVKDIVEPEIMSLFWAKSQPVQSKTIGILSETGFTNS